MASHKLVLQTILQNCTVDWYYDWPVSLCDSLGI